MHTQPPVLCVSGCVGCVRHPAHAATQLERDRRQRSLRLGACAAAHGRLSRRRAAAAARAQPQPQPDRRGRHRRVRTHVRGWRGAARAALGAASLQQCTRLRGPRSMVNRAPCAGPELGSWAFSGRAWRLRPSLHSQEQRPSHWAPSHCLGCSSEPPPKSPPLRACGHSGLEALASACRGGAWPQERLHHTSTIPISRPKPKPGPEPGPC